MSDRIGPDLSVPAGLVAQLFIKGPLVENSDGTGYTGRSACGGVVIVTFVSEGFHEAREAATTSARGTVSPKVRAMAVDALAQWSRDDLFRSRSFWANASGLDPVTLASLCDEKPDRPRPPLRDEYEKASATRKVRRNRSGKAKS